jgi:catechol 2,3-dioxygenase-like lactoylglutathione lyase family enzyme
MNLKNLSIALFVKDIEVSKNFYVNILQQQINLDFGKNVIFKSGFTIWEINESHIIPVKIGISEISNNKVNRFELYFETENIQEIWTTLKKKNIKFLHEIHEEPWGQCTIRFFDPDNHLIEVGESMEQFVGKYYKKGMTVEQVSAKTSVPISEIKRLLKIN